MKHVMALTVLIPVLAWSQQPQNLPMGSGEPSSLVELTHTPGFMPGYPTSAVIWPRVIQLVGHRNPDGTVTCPGYEITPDIGRGEYVYTECHVEQPPVPATNTGTHEITHEITHDVIIREVPPRPGRE